MELIGIVFSIVSFYVAVINISKINFSKQNKFLICIAGSFLTYTVFLVFNSRLTANIFVLVLTMLIINKKIKSIPLSVFTSCLSMITYLLSGHIILAIAKFLFNSLSSKFLINNISTLFIYSTSVLILTFIISKLLGEYINKKLNIFSYELKSKFSAYMIIGSLLTLALYYTNIFISDIIEYRYISQIIITALLGCYFFFFIVMLYMFTLSVKKEIEAKHQQELLQNLQSYTSHIESLYSEMRSFRHDYLNIISSIYGYIELDDTDSLKEYFQEKIMPMSNKVRTYNTSLDNLQFIKIPELKGLLALKLMYAQDTGIDVVIDINENIEGISLDTVNLCRIVGILIDNAIDECMKNISESSLKFCAFNKEGTVNLLFINSINSDKIIIPLLFNEGYSTKGENRGLGLYNLQTILNVHEETSLSTNIINNDFVQQLFLKRNSVITSSFVY